MCDRWCLHVIMLIFLTQFILYTGYIHVYIIVIIPTSLYQNQVNKWKLVGGGHSNIYAFWWRTFKYLCLLVAEIQIYMPFGGGNSNNYAFWWRKFKDLCLLVAEIQNTYAFWWRKFKYICFLVAEIQNIYAFWWRKFKYIRMFCLCRMI